MKIFKYFLITLINLITLFNFAQTVAPVTFRLDLNDVIVNVPNSDSAQVFIQTSVTSWVDIPMEDVGGNGIYRKNINIFHPTGQNIDVFYRFKVTSFGSNGLPYTLWEGGPNADTSCLADPNGYGLAGGLVREVLVPQELIDNGTYVNPSGEFKLTHCFNICGNAPCPPEPCINGLTSTNAYQQCVNGGAQTLIVFEWQTDCEIQSVEYTNAEGAGPFTYPVNSNALNFGVFAGTPNMPPNWSVEHQLTVNFDDGTQSAPIFYTPQPCIPGCMDSTSISYNPWATNDDGSCISSGNSGGCDSIDFEITISITLDNWPGETSWTLVSLSDGGIPIQMPQGEYDFADVGQTYDYTVCIDNLGVELIINDSYGDGLQGGNTPGNVVIYNCDGDTIWELPSPNFGPVAYSGPVQGSACSGTTTILGCMDPMYQEFNPTANIDDGSCLTPHIFGCIDSTSFNYDPAATMQEIIPTCNYELWIGDAAADGWGNSYIGVIQGTNQWTFTMGPGPYNKTFPITLDTDKPVEIYYFEIAAPQQSPQEVEFQTWHNSFKLTNSDGVVLIHEGQNPFANNGQGALQPFESPFYEKYQAIPFCGDLCIPVILGCTDSTSLNYDPLANTDDGTCIPIIYGCTNSLAFNYDSTATVDDGSCIATVYGCTDPTSFNYNSLANVDDGSCIYFGCTDSTALNYDSTANVDNGTCIYPIYGCTDPTMFNYDPNANVDDGSCIPVIYGCMDPTMFNYDSTANTDNGSCIPIMFGCIDSTALNYDPMANTDNGTCILPNLGCTDPNAYNYDPTANVTDSTSCLYDAGCITGPGNPYWLNNGCYAWVISIDPYCCDVTWDASCQNTYDYCDQNSNWTNIEELVVDGGVVIYPNPTKDILNIATSRVQNVLITMFNISGQTVINQTNEKTIDISHLENGVYFINVTVVDLVYIRKVIKQ